MGMSNKKSGLQQAIDITINITQHLKNTGDKELRTKLIQSIFDDQLKIYTSLNRYQRHAARKALKEAMKDNESI